MIEYRVRLKIDTPSLLTAHTSHLDPMLNLFLNLLTLFLAASASDSTTLLTYLHVYYPEHNSRHISDPLIPDVSRFNIPVHFDVLGKTDFNLKACIELIDISMNSTTIPLTCVDNHEFPLINVRPGRYLFTAQLMQIHSGIVLTETRAERVFSVYIFEKNIPKIRCFNCVNNTMKTTATTDTQGLPSLTSVRLNYALSDSVIPSARLHVCVNIQNVIQTSCFPHINNQVLLSNLPVGKYDVHFFIALASNASVIFPSSNQVFYLHILPLALNIPTFSFFNTNVFDFVVSSVSDMANVSIPFSVVGDGHALTQVNTCCQLHALEVGPPRVLQTASKLTCLPSTQPHSSTRTNYVSLPGVPSGVYELRLFMQLVVNSSVLYYTDDDSAVRVQIEVRAPEEVLPSYEWRPLKAWHTVPSGLETRLPMSASPFLVREARIPDPWRLQLALPHPCSFFLRKDVHRTSLIQDVIAAVAQTCERSAACFTLQEESGRVLSASESVESSNLFNTRVYVRISEECAASGSDEPAHSSTGAAGADEAGGRSAEAVGDEQSLAVAGSLAVALNAGSADEL